MSALDNVSDTQSEEPRIQKIDISCIVNLHAEGCMAHRTLSSVERSARHARRAGLLVEVLFICDRPSEETIAMLNRNWQQYPMVIVDYGDPGLSRNHGVASACGNYIAFIDGDDLISENWFTAAWQFGQAGRHFIMHPLLNIIFDSHQCIFQHCNQSEDAFRDGSIFFENLWTSLSFAHRSIYTTVPFLAHSYEYGFGFEDWHFNCSAIAAGFRHRAVPETAHFIRAKAEASVNKEAVRRGLVLSHNALFESQSFLSTHSVPHMAKLC